ncbi:MAG: hypothetical protein A2Y00_07825 [Omnitrophica WOR_2 bacterium GWF2_43_52]|nr:MAG: hypothetical protein A2062_03565 [Omnitrophica WOR_2 bacterium GWA2_44_7]OGX14531.1 MAG: hypothetical protein A2Y01_04355 [Omnitrophica WOR_2 bacterium GWC2_44_8]OGX21351.1 MAG: hypothetical protein A2Y00_07825 [Omnitrophica WOR_2 bacterium GWF2_43_52]OGX58197.1 MAG: hypothetical protein A2460_00125 [Omnitrophica WOR_2 bacterium RIFOXYC2_FULL_43_9]HAH22027.1 hypothetical protein [Candidatus Omnitrophota bacterium]
MEPELSLSDEWVLIAKVKEGRRSSFDTLVSLYQHRGLSIAYTMVGNVEDAQDVLQEAFVKVYISINDFKGKAKFGTWFYRIVVNCALDFLRRRKRSAKVFIDIMADKDEGGIFPEAIDVSTEPRRVSSSREFVYKLDESIATLSRMQRSCFILRHQNRLAIQEIAKVLKCSPSTVKVHLFRAVWRLRKHLLHYFR